MRISAARVPGPAKARVARMSVHRPGGHLASLLRLATLGIVLLGAVPRPLFAAEDLDYKVQDTTQRLEMIVNSSRILSMAGDIPRMLVNNPELVKVTPLSPNQVQLSALKPGVTHVNLWDKSGKAYTVDVIVFRDPRPLEMVLQAEFPQAALRVRPLENSVILSGYVDRPDVISRVVQIASDYYPNVINNINVGGVQQVNLHVKVMEVSRTKLRAAGFDWAAIFGDDFVIQSASGLINPQASGPGGIVGTGQDTVRFGIISQPNQFFGYLRLLSDRQLIKILAEPTLVTVSGRPAAFNEGGEFPILVPQGLGTTAVEYKEFGTRVDFVPIVQGNGNIRLEVRPQVSEIDNSRGVQLNGITVPGIRSRYVDTAVEMRSGQTLALAGLIQNRTEARKRGLPGLMDLPWTGNLFRSTEETINEIELLVVVTPHLVAAVDPGQMPPLGPGEFTASPPDIDFYGRGHIEVPKCCPDRRCVYPETQAPAGPGLPPVGGFETALPHDAGAVQGPHTAPLTEERLNGDLPWTPEQTPYNLAPGTTVDPSLPGGNFGATPGVNPAPVPGLPPTTNPNTAPIGGPTPPPANTQSGSLPDLFGPSGYDELR